MKPIDFTCILRLAKSQLMENGFKDTTIERLYALLLEYAASQSHTIAFPDLYVLAVVQVSTYYILKNEFFLIPTCLKKFRPTNIIVSFALLTSRFMQSSYVT